MATAQSLVSQSSMTCSASMMPSPYKSACVLATGHSVELVNIGTGTHRPMYVDQHCKDDTKLRKIRVRLSAQGGIFSYIYHMQY